MSLHLFYEMIFRSNIEIEEEEKHCGNQGLYWSVGLSGIMKVRYTNIKGIWATDGSRIRMFLSTMSFNFIF